MVKVLIFLLIISSGCSVFKVSKAKFQIDSNPKEAEVSYLLPSGEFKSLGKTPLDIDEKQIQEWKKGKADFLILRVAKSGHANENLFIDLRNHYSINYMARLKPIDVWNNKEAELSSTAANKLAEKIQGINQQIFGKNLEGALKNAESLIEQFPKAHVFYDIKGSILYLMGKRQEAVASYEKSLSINPDNNEAKKIIDAVKKGSAQ